MSSLHVSLFTLLSASALATSTLAAGRTEPDQPANAYRVLHKIPVPGDGGYDFVYLEHRTG
jgi:hypothetical protein